MKTFYIVAKDDSKVDEVKALFESKGFKFVKDAPDFIVCLGGDGTFLMSERQYPGVPKLLVRDSLVCFKCHDEPIQEMIEKLLEGRVFAKDFMKLEASYDSKSFIAANDVIIRNNDPTRGVRFSVFVDGKQVYDNLIGDGLVIATPFGATGYYKSITRDEFCNGIGIAFNNTTKEVEHLKVPEDSEVIVKIIRGEAQLAHDNSRDIVLMQPGDSVTVKKSSDVSRLLVHA
ncbi:hypothetical protein ACFL1B_02890 [Nanoarchaeota archaeon]